MKYKTSNRDELFTDNGVLTEKNWKFLKAIEALVNAQPEYFNNKAELNTAIPSPADRQRAYVIGQGECRYKKSVLDWVLIADDSTVIV